MDDPNQDGVLAGVQVEAVVRAAVAAVQSNPEWGTLTGRPPP